MLSNENLNKMENFMEHVKNSQSGMNQEPAFKFDREYVTQNPGRGVAVTAAAGALVGSILTLVMRRSSK